MKKGFTLIELLAVIVILAIIALIATPIILGIINDAKEDSEKRSVENYAHAVELAVARYATGNGGMIYDGTYTIAPDNKQIIYDKDSSIIIPVDYKGEKITGTVEVDAKGKIKLLGVSINASDVLYDYSEENGVEKIYEAVSLFGGSYEGEGFTLAQNYGFWYTYYTDSKTCLWGALNEELKLAGEQNIKIEYLNSDIFPHYLTIYSSALEIFSTELVEGEVTVEIKDNHGKVTTINDTVDMIDGQGLVYTYWSELNYSDDFEYYVGLLEKGENITITVTQNGKNYILGGSEFKYSDGEDDPCQSEHYYWGNTKLGYYSGC